MLLSRVDFDPATVRCVFLECDPRVHSVLGMSSYVKMRTVRPTKLDAQLEEATTEFCRRCVILRQDSATVVLPKVMEWFLKDFSSSHQGLLLWLVKYMPSEVRFFVDLRGCACCFRER